jgi:hypothetical protein
MRRINTPRSKHWANQAQLPRIFRNTPCMKITSEHHGQLCSSAALQLFERKDAFPMKMASISIEKYGGKQKGKGGSNFEIAISEIFVVSRLNA